MRAPIILSVSRSYPGTDNIESMARAGVEGYAATMAGVQDAVRLEAESAAYVCGAAADAELRCCCNANWRVLHRTTRHMAMMLMR